MLKSLKFIFFSMVGLIRVKLFQITHPKAEIGKNLRLDWQTKLDIRNNKIIVGDNVYLRSNGNGYHTGIPFPTTILIDGKNAFCEIGNNSTIVGTYIHAQRGIKIGNNTLIGAGTNILDSNAHLTKDFCRSRTRDEPLEITIGSNVWIGLNSTVLKGTFIGDNSVISAGSVVKGNIPKNSIVQGNPAVVVSKIVI